MPEVIRTRAGQFLFCLLLLSSVAVTPWTNLDPINIPKLVVLSSGALAIVGLLSGSTLSSSTTMQKAIVTLFLLSLVASIYRGQRNFLGQFYGDFGRLTGGFIYVVLILLFWTLAANSNRFMAKRTVLSLSIIVVLNIGYSLIQFAGKDPINWNNPYNPIIGTFGNPNFLSAFLGISCSVGTAYLFSSDTSTSIRVMIFTAVTLSVFIILQSTSIQGIFVLIASSTFVIYQRFLHYQKVRWKLTYLAIAALGIFLAILGTLQLGPLKHLLYQPSITYRGDYWRAGLVMIKDHPLTGVGLDSYSDYYRATRSETATLRRGADTVSNSAHNVFIDFGSSGGVPLLLSYLALCTLVLHSAYKLLRKIKGYDPLVVGLIAAWLAYQLQSTISINQNALATWGWVIGGLIVGLNRTESFNAAKNSGKRMQGLLPPRYLLSSLAGLLIGLIITMPLYIKDSRFRTALENRNGARIVKAAEGFPQLHFYLDTGSANLIADKRFALQGLNLAKKAVEINPRDFQGWELISKNPQSSPAEKETALAMMKKLDPFNEDIRP